MTESQQAPDIPVPPPPKGPWGAWASIGLLMMIVFFQFAIQVLLLIVFALVAKEGYTGIGDFIEKMLGNGDFLTASVLFTDPAQALITVLFVKFRRGLPLFQYLGLKQVSVKNYLFWVLVIGMVFFGSDGLSMMLGRQIVPPFMVDIYSTCSFLPLLWFAAVIVAPLVEELLFRGFLFTGLRSSRLGAPGAILVPALFWSLMHGQYDLYEIVTIFATGIVLGVARERTGSIYPAVAMHSVMNFIAAVEAAIKLAS